MQVILLEKIEKLGDLGSLVDVKPGFARNFLFPKNKALRATKQNITYFETQKAALEKVNSDKKSEAENIAKSVENTSVIIIRSASDTGQLYGSVTTRDIASSLTELSGTPITRNHVMLDTPIKSIGLHDFKIRLHSEVIVGIKVNVARSVEEAEVQAKSVEKKHHNKEGTAKVVDTFDEGDVSTQAGSQQDSRAIAKKAIDDAQALQDAALREIEDIRHSKSKSTGDKTTAPKVDEGKS